MATNAYNEQMVDINEQMYSYVHLGSNNINYQLWEI